MAAAAQGLMLKSSKWAPYEPPQEMLRALEERCAGQSVAGGSPACPAVPVMLSLNAVHQEGLWPWLRPVSCPRKQVQNPHCPVCSLLYNWYIQCRVGSRKGRFVGTPAD